MTDTFDLDKYPVAPEAAVKELLRTEWNTDWAGEPDIHHGWVDPDGTSLEVTVSNPDENPTGGGETGYSGIAGDGSGPVQDINGTVAVNVWADRNRTDANPRMAVYAMKAEVERIITAHAQAESTEDVDLTGLRFLGIVGPVTRFVEDELDPVRYRYQVTVGYGYQRRQAATDGGFGLTPFGTNFGDPEQ